MKQSSPILLKHVHIPNFIIEVTRKTETYCEGNVALYEKDGSGVLKYIGWKDNNLWKAEWISNNFTEMTNTEISIFKYSLKLMEWESNKPIMPTPSLELNQVKIQILRPNNLQVGNYVFEPQSILKLKDFLNTYF